MIPGSPVTPSATSTYSMAGWSPPPAKAASGLDRDWPVELARFAHLRLHAPGRLLLRVALVENRREMLRARIVVMPVQRGGIVHPEKAMQQVLATQPGR